MPTDTYDMLKFIEAFGEVRGRKRLQKTVFMLKRQGCDFFQERFSMHYYGPYSSELSALVDELVQQGLVNEEAKTAGTSAVEYTYRLTGNGETFINNFQQRHNGGRPATKWNKSLLSRVLKLADVEVYVLELAATILFWIDWGLNWKKATARTRSMKNVSEGSSNWEKACALAKQMCSRVSA